MVVVGAVIGKENSADARILEAVETGVVRIAISDASLNELVDVMGKPDVESKITRKPKAAQRLVRTALNIGLMATLHHPRRIHWPNLMDADDSWLLDLALEARPDYIVTRGNGVLRDAPKSGFDAITPPEFVERENLSTALLRAKPTVSKVDYHIS